MQNINHTFDIATIENIASKIGKVGKRDQFIGYEIKIKTECNSNFLECLALGEPPDYDGFFFEEGGELKASFISSFVVSREIKDHKMLIDLDLVSERLMYFLKINIKNFKIMPVYGDQYIVHFSAQLETNDDELLFLNEAVQKDQLKISIIEPAQLSIDFENH